MSLLVSQIISAVKSRAAIPDTSAEGYTDTDILEWIQSCLDDTVYPQIVDMVEDFFIVKASIPLRDANNLPLYSNRIVPLPARCFGWQVRELKYRDAAGNVYNIPQVSLEDEETATTRSLRAAAGNFVPGFFITNDSIRIIHETTNLGGYLDITYVVKPSVLYISTTLCPLITKITKSRPVTDVSSGIVIPYDVNLVYAGKATGGGAATITLAASVVDTDQTVFNGLKVTILAGTGVGQTATVASTGNNWDNATKVLTVSTNWTTQPDNTSIYNVLYITDTPNITTITPTSVGTDLTAYCADGATALFDVYKKSTGALIKTDLPMTRNSSTFVTVFMHANETQEIMNYQAGGFTGTLGNMTSGGVSELVLCPANQNVYTPLPKEADQLLIASVTGRYLESLGDTEGLGVVKAQEDRIRKNLVKILGRRMIGESKVFVNRHGWKRWFSGSRYGGW